MPVLGGKASKNALYASSPPAEAPMPTTKLGRVFFICLTSAESLNAFALFIYFWHEYFCQFSFSDQSLLSQHRPWVGDEFHHRLKSFFERHLNGPCHATLRCTGRERVFYPELLPIPSRPSRCQSERRPRFHHWCHFGRLKKPDS